MSVGEHPKGGAIELLFERKDLPRFDLPGDLASAYGGAIGFEAPRVIANFVESLDGVVALPENDESGHIISGDNDADRFVMGLLRASADAVMVGAGTYRKASQAIFDAAAIYPALSASFAELRTRLGLAPRPRFVLVTDVADIDVSGPALAGATIFTTSRGANVLADRVPKSTRVVALSPERPRISDALRLLQAEGARLVLTEGGPSPCVAEIVAEGALDELFVTTSPTVFGRFPNDGRKSLLDGQDLARNTARARLGAPPRLAPLFALPDQKSLDFRRFRR